MDVLRFGRHFRLANVYSADDGGGMNVSGGGGYAVPSPAQPQMQSSLSMSLETVLNSPPVSMSSSTGGGGGLSQAQTLQGLMQPPSASSPMPALQFSPANVSTKEWHQQITLTHNNDLRNHLIHKL